MKSLFLGLGALVLIVGVVGGVYFWTHPAEPLNRDVALQPSPSVQPQPQAQVQASPTPLYPVPAENALPASDIPAVARKPVPPLDQSDQTLDEALRELFGKERFLSLFINNNIVRRIVVTIDNLPRHKQTPADFLPLKTLGPGFAVSGSGQSFSINPTNYVRYQPYLDLIESVNAKKLVAVYVHFYPIFQAAYRDLGTRKYFNERVIEAIDDCLATPDLENPIPVVPYGLGHHYKFADPKIEGLSSGQKLLIRMGRENRRLIQAKLREIRSELVHIHKS